MGRNRKSVVYRYFNIDENRKTATCLINECGKVLKNCHQVKNTNQNECDLTIHGSNLTKHLKHMHLEEYKLTIESNSLTPTTRSTVGDSIIKECTNLIAVHGRPFSILDDEAFQNLLKMIPNHNTAINASKIRSNVEAMAEKLRNEMTTMLQGKILCLKVDIASVATRCFFGINGQYMEDGQIILKNLAVLEIFERHTSDHLKDLLLYSIQKYRIEAHQIYTITTDNGANMIKMAKLMNEANADANIPDRAEAGSSSSQITNLFTEDSGSDLEDHNMEWEGNTIERLTTRLTENLGVEFENLAVEPSGDAAYSIGLVRCAAHTLQLALHDASNHPNTRALIVDCREVVRRLRTPQFVRIIRQENQLVPKLDCTTRWHSTVDMAQSLISLKGICTTHERLHLPSATWSALEDYVKCMTPAKVLTKKLQEEQLTVGDFYLQWSLCQFKLAKMNIELANLIITKMKEREGALFGTDIFINAVFMDPRVNSILTLDQQRKAKENLIKLFFHHCKVQLNTETSLEQTNIENENNDARAELDDFLNTAYVNRLSDISILLRRDDPRGEVTNNLRQALNLFFEEPLLRSTESVLKYWQNNKLKFPFLYEISKIVLATPMTQVSVERLFSSLKFIVSNHRFSMKDKIINDILFLRSNAIFSKK